MINGLYEFAKKWSAKGSVWIVSDTHFDDPDRDFMGYEISTEEHASLIKATVCKKDTLIHLGDVGNPEYLKDVPGYKILVLGNHDYTATKYKPYFDEVYEGPVIISRKIILSHEWLPVDWMFNIHGHDHNPAHTGDDYHLNLAANVYGYKPAHLGALIKCGLVSHINTVHRRAIDLAVERKSENHET